MRGKNSIFWLFTRPWTTLPHRRVAEKSFAFLFNFRKKFEGIPYCNGSHPPSLGRQLRHSNLTSDSSLALSLFPLDQLRSPTSISSPSALHHTPLVSHHPHFNDFFATLCSFQTARSTVSRHSYQAFYLLLLDSNMGLSLHTKALS